MNFGNNYDLTVKYPSSLGGLIFKNMKLAGEFLGPDIVRATVEPNVDTIWFNILNEASSEDMIRTYKIQDLVFYIFVDLENVKRVFAKEWIDDYKESGNDYTFKATDLTVEQKMVLIKTLKNLGITITEI